MDQKEIEFFVEAALLAAGRPLNVDQIQDLFDGRSVPEKAAVRAAITALNESYQERGIVIGEVASGFRLQIKTRMADRLNKLWEERPPRYSRALFETLALIAYRQPITRGEIEEIRGVAVSSNIMRSLVEREWVRVVGHRDVPGRPAMFGTTKAFLDYFSLKKLDDLPELADLSDWESLRVQLDLPEVDGATANDEDGGPENAAESLVSLATVGLNTASNEQSAADSDENPELLQHHQDDSGEPAVEEPQADIPELQADEGDDSIELPELQVEEEEQSDVELPELSDLIEQTNPDGEPGTTDNEELIVSEWPKPESDENDEAIDSAVADKSKDS